jgi:16S rRNA (uracil1498-N3)-methyltransferase
MQLFYAPDIKNKAELPEEEARHCLKILRHGAGDHIRVADGKGSFYDCKILDTKKCSLEILGVTQEKKRERFLHLAVAPTKSGERTDWMIEKLVEFGIDELTFLDCTNSERAKINMERCERVAVSAMKQSLKATLPKLNPLISFGDHIKNIKGNSAAKLIAHCSEEIAKNPLQTTNGNRNIVCCIGPEGDFSKKEIEMATGAGFIGVALGTSRLRTETAAIAVCSYFYFDTNAGV